MNERDDEEELDLLGDMSDGELIRKMVRMNAAANIRMAKSACKKHSKMLDTNPDGAAKLMVSLATSMSVIMTGYERLAMLSERISKLHGDQENRPVTMPSIEDDPMYEQIRYMTERIDKRLALGNGRGNGHGQ